MTDRRALYMLAGSWLILLTLHALGYNDEISVALGGASAALFGYFVHALGSSPAG